jgi:hypothetical protein
MEWFFSTPYSVKWLIMLIKGEIAEACCGFSLAQLVPILNGICKSAH